MQSNNLSFCKQRKVLTGGSEEQVAELLLGGGRRKRQTKPQAPSKASIQLGNLLKILINTNLLNKV
jgi:hypothetical protein